MTSVVLVIAQARDGEPPWGVARPTSASFTGRSGGKDSERFEISLLDRASVHANGTVELSDGACLRAVNVVTTALCWELTEIQKRIVYWTIKFIEAEAKCYRYGPPTPGLAWLDYGTLYGLELPKLEAIAQYIADNDPTLRVSRQTIANALSACGLRARLAA